MSVAFFDLDRTVLDCNSGRLWVAHEWREGRISWRDVLWAGWWLGRYSLGAAEGLEAVFETAVASYEGEEEAMVVARTKQWFDAECAGRIRPGATAALQRHREAGDRIVLATSSTLYAALAAQALWGFDDLVCTRLEVADGRFTGKISAMGYGDAKLTLCREWAAANQVALAECTFYTDSVTDHALMRVVGRPVAVNPDRKLAVLATSEGWPIEDWGTASL